MKLSLSREVLADCSFLLVFPLDFLSESKFGIIKAESFLSNIFLLLSRSNFYPGRIVSKNNSKGLTTLILSGPGMHLIYNSKA